MSAAKVTWVLLDGSQQTHEVPDGVNLMQAAVLYKIDGIVGRCGGNMSCATCHVYVDAAFADKVGAAGPVEDGMLEIAATDRRGESRLSCQLIASSELDGIVLHVAGEN